MSSNLKDIGTCSLMSSGLRWTLLCLWQPHWPSPVLKQRHGVRPVVTHTELNVESFPLSSSLYILKMLCLEFLDVFFFPMGNSYTYIICYCLFVFWDRVSLCRPGWPRTQTFACLCLPSASIKGMYHHVWLLIWFLKMLSFSVSHVLSQLSDPRMPHSEVSRRVCEYYSEH